MRDRIVPEWNLAVYIMVVDVRQWSEVQVPLVRIPLLKREVRVTKLVAFLHNRVLKIVTQAQRAVAVIVVVHPLIDRGRALADGFQSRMGVKQRRAGRVTTVGSPPDAHA